MRLLLAAFSLACASLHAQSTEAAISGIVTDAHGAVIPNVEVTAVQTDTGVKTAVRTNETGFYSISPLPIGSYSLSAGANGFRRFTEQGIVLTTGQAFEVNIRLEVGAVNETVTVSATGTLLETRTSDASQLIESKTIEDMPLGDRRAMNIIEITGAAVFGGYDAGSKPNFSLAGGRMQSQMFFIDGASAQNMRVGVGQMDLDPPIDTLQEVKVMSNSFSAEFGGSAGGGVIATTKSGTNQIRGSLSEYLRNQDMDAPNFFSPIVNGQKQKPSLRYNVFGGTVGGPVKHDKTFFFAAYEGSRRRDGSVRTLTVPSLLERSGDFSQTFNSRRQLYPVYDPFTNPRVIFPGNIIPKDRFDPVALKILPAFPLPNRAPDDATGANNFRANDVNAYTRNNVIAKIDHNLGNNDKLSFRYLFNSDVNRQRSVFPVPAADTINDTDAHQQYWYGTWTRIVSPTIVNDVRFNYGRRYYRTHNKGIDEGWPSKLGLTGVPENSFPTIVTAGYTNLGSGTQDRQQFPIQQVNILENITIIRGRHTIKAGAEVRLSRNHDLLLSSISGKYTFNRGLSGLAGNAQTGNGIATMLLGALSNFDQQATPVLNRHAWYLAGFWQDDWTVRPGLTLNLGVRWETDTPIIDAENHMNSFDANQINPVSGTPGVIKFLGLNGYPAQPYRGDYNNFGPRVGFAWKPFGLQNTVVRGGFGVFYSHPFDGAQANTATLGFAESSALVVQDNTTTVPYTLGGGLPIQKLTSPVLDDTFGAVKVGQAVSTTITYLDPSRRTGYSEQFNLRIQHELRGSILVEIGYLGNLGRKLPGANIAINQIRPEILGPSTQQRNRPFPQFSGVTILAPAFGVSSYSAGTAKIEKRFARGVSVLATYTWAKFLDNTGSGPGAHLGDEGAAYSNYYNRRADWGPSENDIRHRLTWSSVYQIPVGRGRRYFNSGPLRNVIGGWQLGGVMVLQTGAPSTVQTQTNTTFAFSSGAQRANILRDPNPSSGRTLDHWFDTDAFAQPGTNQFGDQGVGLVRADGIFNVNASIIRAFRLAERKTFQFRGEFFNLLNHPNFLVPGHTFNGPGFGIVDAARAARQVQLGLRLNF
jgi:Carboxypeptidase regulatory-like domain